MLKRTKKWLSLVLAALVMVSSLAGCSSTDTSTPADTTTSTPPASSEEPVEETTGSPLAANSENKTITVNTAAGPGAAEAWQAVADGYMAINPDIEVVIDLKPSEGYSDWVQNIFNTEDPTSDIVAINLAGSSSEGKSINFLEYATMDSYYSDGIWTDQFNYSMQVQDLAKGNWDALSLDSVQVLWFYNKAIFEEVGVEPPTTWDELIAVSEKIAAAGYQPIAIPGDFDSFWSGTMGWLSQIYADQTTRSMIEVYRAQEGDYCYDPDIDGSFAFDPTDPYNDDSWKVTSNPVRAYKAVLDGTYAADSEGMKTVWTNFAQVFPAYAGGDAFFGTANSSINPLFYQGEAAMMVNGGWFMTEFARDMAKVAAGEDVTTGTGDTEAVVEGIQQFELGTFNMPSMEGDGIEAPARTIEVATGFLGAISKDKAHDDLVVDFLMYYSSTEGQSLYLSALIENDGPVNGPSLVYGVELPADIQAMFDNLSFIGNCQKGYGQMLARGLASTDGDIQESYRQFYDYSYDYLSGASTVEDWLASHQGNVDQYIQQSLDLSGISATDIENPQNEPTGQ